MTDKAQHLSDDPLSPDELLEINAKMLRTWGGENDPTTPFITRANATGQKPPLVWVFQAKSEFESLARALPTDQPLLGMKSMVIRGDKEWLKNNRWLVEPSMLSAVSAAYTQDVLSAVKQGPYLLGGNCAGSILAVDLARQVPDKPACLFLMNLLKDAGPYDHPVELLFGSAEEKRFRDFELGETAFADAHTTRLEGGHGSYFRSQAVEVISETICRRASQIAV